jgi:hypothetical protein
VTDIAELEANIFEKAQELRAAIEAMVAVTGQSFTPWAPHLSDSQLINCRVLPSRYHILDYMPKHGVCVEVGSQAGNFAVEILSRTQPSKFHIVDLYLDQFEQREKMQADIDSGRVELHEGYSAEVLDTFDDGYFDWIYIDADHSYEGFVKDLRISTRKLKPNGFIVCNDYTVWSPAEVFGYGILRGVHEVCVSDNWEFVFIGLHGQGYHDVCIRKRIGEIGAR